MIITTNGNYQVLQTSPRNWSRVAIFISGALGAATVTLTYIDDFGSYIALTDGDVTDLPTQLAASLGDNMPLYLTVTGADGSTNISMLARDLN